MLSLGLRAAALCLLLGRLVRAAGPVPDVPHIAVYFGTKTRYEDVNRNLLRDLTSVNLSVLRSPDTERCVPVHLTAVIRHGSRYPTVGNIRKIRELSELVRTEAARGPGTGTEDWLLDIRNHWHMWYTDDMDGELVRKGRADLRHLARRLAAMFPALLSEQHLRGRSLSFRSSSKRRCRDSMDAFQEGLWGTHTEPQAGHQVDDAPLRHQGDDALLRHQVDDAPLRHQVDDAPLRHQVDEAPLRHQVDDAPLRHQGDDALLRHQVDDAPLRHQVDDAPLRHQVDDAPLRHQVDEAPLRHQVDDALLRSFERCRGYVQRVEQNRSALMEEERFRHGAELEQVRRKVERKLTLPPHRLTADLLEAAFFLCSYELSIKSLHSPWCFLFDEDDAKVLEYLSDLKQYWKRSHGHQISAMSSCPLFHHVFRTLDKAGRPRRSTDAPPEPASVLLGHAETLLPLLALLGLYRDPTPPTAHNYQSQHGRRFRSGLLVPYAANLLFVLWDCGGAPPRLQLLLNEAPVRFPGLEAQAAPLYRDVRAAYRPLLDGCDFQRECEGEGGAEGGGPGGRAPNTEL